MKKTQTKNADQKSHAVSESEMEQILTHMQKLREEEKQVRDSIEVVHEYNEKTNCGFGWRKTDGKLVEFQTEVDGFYGKVNVYLVEITLAESLEWIEHMQFAEQLLNICMQTGDGYVRWIQALRAEVV